MVVFSKPGLLLATASFVMPICASAIAHVPNAALIDLEARDVTVTVTITECPSSTAGIPGTSVCSEPTSSATIVPGVSASSSVATVTTIVTTSYPPVDTNPPSFPSLSTNPAVTTPAIVVSTTPAPGTISTPSSVATDITSASIPVPTVSTTVTSAVTTTPASTSSAIPPAPNAAIKADIGTNMMGAVAMVVAVAAFAGV